MAFNRHILGEENFERVMAYINNPSENQKRDRFSQKFGLLVCNEFYIDKSGLKDLSSTKLDFANIKITARMMNIKQENMIELIDVSREELD